MMNERLDDADIESLLSDDERGRSFKKMLFQAPRVQATLRVLLPYYDQLKLFD